MGRKPERSKLPTPSERAKTDPAYAQLRDQRRQSFGKAIKRLREVDSIDQADLAARTGLHRAYIGQVERGEANITIDNMWAIADGFDVELAELVEE